jgi:TetR/AcrR family transcriptional regulator, regulator of cefoperazone and chloramphenicol sensitivity
MITDGTSAGDHLFDRLVAEVETYLADGVANGSMTENSDPRMLALVITIYGLAPLIMQRQLGRVLGGDVLTDTIAKRMTLPVLELYTHGLYTDDSMLRAAREVLASDTTNREEHGQ